MKAPWEVSQPHSRPSSRLRQTGSAARETSQSLPAPGSSESDSPVSQSAIHPRATRQLLLCTILVQLTWSPGARRDPTTVCEELMQEAESPFFWHLSPSQLSGSHPVQAPKVLTGGTVILVLHRGRHTRPWRAEGCAWPRCPDRSTGDRHHLMPSRLQQSLQNLCYFKFLCHHCKQTGLRESD